jgi:hypothetical protein
VTLKASYIAGYKAAMLKFAGPMGADVGVQPKGDEVSHGTAMVQYAKGKPPTADEARANMPDWLWDGFTTYDNIAPGRADGSFGQETIG